MFNGSGSYQAPANSWNPAVDGTDLNSTDWAALLADLTTALSTCILKDGQQVAMASINFAQGLSSPDSTFVLKNSSDATKTAVFSLAGITTGTKRTYTLPDASDTFVMLGASQTLTNKTLTSPTINSPTMSGSVTGALTFVGNQIITGSLRIDLGATGSGFVATGPGSNFQIGFPNSGPITQIINTGGGGFAFRNGANNADVAVINDNGINLTTGTTITINSVPLGITLGTPAASTSGTAINFTGIPATARRVAVNFKGVSSSGSSNIQVQPGPVGGVETTGYLSRATEISSTGTSATSGFLLTSTGLTSSSVIHGTIILTLENTSAFSWCAMGLLNDSGNNVQYSSSGSKSFAAAMTQLTITTVNGTDTFDAGEINIQYE